MLTNNTMNHALLDVLKTFFRPRWAAGVLALFGALALLSECGANVGGQGLDPVWAAAQQRGVLRVATDFGYLPFSGWQDGEPYGYDVDLARAVGAKLGLSVEFVGTSLDAVYDDLSAGKADLAASALPYAPEQGWRATFSEFYFNAGQVLVVPAASDVTGTGDLGGRRVGAALGSDADTLLRSLARTDMRIVAVSAYDTPTAALDALAGGALDAAIVDNATALVALRSTPSLRLVTPALTLEPYALAMPAGAFQLHSEVNRALAELRREGFFEANGERWFRVQGSGSDQGASRAGCCPAPLATPVVPRWPLWFLW